MNRAQEPYDIIIVGGGPGGLSAAYSAQQNGAKRILVLERDREVGGILQQCVHNGFGLHHFKEELTGPGYAQRCYDLVKDKPEIEIQTDTMVLSVGVDKTVLAVSPTRGREELCAKAIILTMGCRERTRGAIRIPGTRPAGVYTAGAAQRMVNMEGYLPGHRIVILGSGDIGLIMARRMALEGCKVEAVLEICPYSNGLTRNIVQCLNDYDIPLYLSHTIVAIEGRDRVTGVRAAKVDERMRPLPDTVFSIPCDTVLLSVGLIPENELSCALGLEIHPKTGGPVVDQHRETSQAGIFAAGNVVHVHDLVDFVSEEAEIAGKYAARCARGEERAARRSLGVWPGDGVNTCVPQRLSLSEGEAPVRLFMRAARPMRGATLTVKGAGGDVLLSKRLAVAKPSEMIAVEMDGARLLDLTGDVTVSLEEEARD
ncbi:MAG: NAD(P)/FAD-dependent oxidoreductase [Schwartzia sp. (in: firmicutes)]